MRSPAWSADIGVACVVGRHTAYGVGEDGVQAFTDLGIENLIELVRFYKENPKLLTRWQRE